MQNKSRKFLSILLAFALLVSVAKITSASPIITGQPQNITIMPQGQASFTVKATGTGELTYQWYGISPATPFVAGKPGLVTNGGIFSGAKTKTLVLTDVHTAFNGSHFRCVVTDTQGSDVISDYAYLTVERPTPSEPPKIKNHPTDITVKSGENAVFRIVAEESAAEQLYQWEYSEGSSWGSAVGGMFSGWSTQTLTVSSVPITANNMRFRCKVTNKAGATYSNEAKLTVLSNSVRPLLQKPSLQKIKPELVKPVKPGVR